MAMSELEKSLSFPVILLISINSIMASISNLIRLHTDQLSAAKLKFRDDLQQHQQVYLDQLRVCKEEIRELKVALRQEQSRNRRLQQMLRGEV